MCVKTFPFSICLSQEIFFKSLPIGLKNNNKKAKKEDKNTLYAQLNTYAEQLFIIQKKKGYSADRIDTLHKP